MTRFSLRISLYFAVLSFLSALTSPSVPASKKTTPKHDAASTMLYRWDGIVQGMTGAWFPQDMMHSFFIQAAGQGQVVLVLYFLCGIGPLPFLELLLYHIILVSAGCSK